MIVVTKQTCRINNIEVIVDDNGILWLNEKYIEEKLNHENLRAITTKCHLDYRIHKFELVDKLKEQ